MLLSATTSKTVELTEILKIYTSWKRITLPSYSVPGRLSRLCTLPAHPGEIIEDDTDAEVPVRVFATAYEACAACHKTAEHDWCSPLI